MQTWEQYEAYYRKTGRLIHDIGPRSNELTDRGLRARYDRYVKLNDRKAEKMRSKDPPTTYGHLVQGRPCQLRSHLQSSTGMTFLSSATSLGTLEDLLRLAPRFMLDKIDPAHIFSRGANKSMHNLGDNIIPLNRYSHSMIDIWKHPVFGTPITDLERDEFWRIMVGPERYELLLKISKER